MESLFSILSGRSLLSEEQLSRLKSDASSSGKSYTEIIKEGNLIGEESLLKILSEELSIPFADLDEINELTLPALQNKVSLPFMRESKIVPIHIDGKTLSVVTCDPLNYERFEELEQMTGFTLALQVATENQIMVAIERFFGVGSHSMDVIIGDMDDDETALWSDNTDEVEHLKDLASEAPVIKLVNLLITKAIEIGASDIHIEPFEHELATRYRVDGILHEAESPPLKLQAALISRLKIMAKL
ncbi:MAG: GspE/PulE family protein, partial [Nitrospinota bacterium]